MSVTCPTGQVLRDDEGMRLEYVRSFAAGVDEVWAAITDPALLGRWFGTWTGDPADGSVALRMLEGGDAVAIAIRECAAPVRLAITIPNGGDAWPLQLSLEGDGARSTLVVHPPAGRAVRRHEHRPRLALLPRPARRRRRRLPRSR